MHECAGSQCRVQRADGAAATLRFPQRVASEQPVQGFTDLVALAHEDVPGRWIELKFSGDVFEMEDQRNWIDASFKTLCDVIAAALIVAERTSTDGRVVVPGAVAVERTSTDGRVVVPGAVA